MQTWTLSAKGYKTLTALVDHGLRNRQEALATLRLALILTMSRLTTIVCSVVRHGHTGYHIVSYWGIVVGDDDMNSHFKKTTSVYIIICYHLRVGVIYSQP